MANRSNLNLRFNVFLILLSGLMLGTTLYAGEKQNAGHVLNRIAYGPSAADLETIAQKGIAAYVAEQLDPASIDESDNQMLLEREADLFEEKIPARESILVGVGTAWRYFKGTQEPPATWAQNGFNDTNWLSGPTGIGYGDDDDETVLDDMRQVNNQSGYISVYLRKTFRLTPEALGDLDDLVLRVDYDDSFKAFINGEEVTQRNLPMGPVSFNQRASASREAGTPETILLNAFKDRLQAGENVLAIQAHNRGLTSSDFSIIPELLGSTRLPGPPQQVIKGINALQQLVHVRGVYSRRQLQTVLAEFWENHFTTDYDKLVEYFDELQNSDATDAMSKDQAKAEAAQLEYLEYQFYYENALGNFGDLLLYSATAPTMLIYLDNVLNIKGAANENYAREILELSAFGVDNRYTQKDIEELAKCFTGWTVTKVGYDQTLPFPQSAAQPPIEGGVQFEDTAIIDLGPGWTYFKGTAEPSPNGNGQATTAWTEKNFDDSAWLRGATGIGYGDGDDTTTLNDMRNNYSSVYLRRRFQVVDPQQFNGLILEVAYDDGFVAYLNGTEIARSETMEGKGKPPAFDRSSDSHEVSAGVDTFNLAGHRNLLVSGENILAIQVHNTSRGSSDLSMLPRLLDRRILPGSIENGDRNGAWVFRFAPEHHDTRRKVLYEGTPHETIIPAGRTGRDGLLDALVPVLAMAAHPSTAEFICIKLIQRFVSDRLTLENFKDGSADPALLALLDQAINAWQSTEPPGHIQTVMRTLLDPENQTNLFWSDLAYRAKVKTSFEFINSSLRALKADASGKDLPGLNDDMGMHLFTRDDPDGYSELGVDWMDTASMLQRTEFVRRLAANGDNDYTWDTLGYLDALGLASPDQIVDHFNTVLYQNTLSEADKIRVLEFLNTDQNGQLKPLDRQNTTDFEQRVQACLGYMLSLPQWHFQ